MLKCGKEAMKNGVLDVDGRTISGFASNGLLFRGFVENGEVTNFFPKLP